MFYLGVDVAKKKLDFMLHDTSTNKSKSKGDIANTPAGFVEILEWLAKQDAENPHVVTEPTGMYHGAAALALADAGWWSRLLILPSCEHSPKAWASRRKRTNKTAPCWRATARLRSRSLGSRQRRQHTSSKHFWRGGTLSLTIFSGKRIDKKPTTGA